MEILGNRNPNEKPRPENEMTTYVYQTIPESEETEPEYFEIRQSMEDPPLEKHPETGVPIKRVVLGGYGLKTTPSSSGDAGGCCGPSGCC